MEAFFSSPSLSFGTYFQLEVFTTSEIVHKSNLNPMCVHLKESPVVPNGAYSQVSQRVYGPEIVLGFVRQFYG